MKLLTAASILNVAGLERPLLKDRSGEDVKARGQAGLARLGRRREAGRLSTRPVGAAAFTLSLSRHT